MKRVIGESAMLGISFFSPAAAGREQIVIAPHHPDRLRRPAVRPSTVEKDRFHQTLLWNTFRTLELLPPAFWLRRLQARLHMEWFPGATFFQEDRMAKSMEATNMELMQTLDDAWNAQDVEIFRARHKPDVVVRWPGQPNPTVGIEDHTAESIAFWKTFPDQKLDNRPYRVFFASGDWTCSIARFRGTMKGPMVMGGKEIPPTGKSFEVDFYTIAKWHDGQIVEENLMYDLVGFLQQIGLSK